MASKPLRYSVHIAAEPDRIFEYFTRAEAILQWIGDYAVVDPRPGGEFAVDIEGVPVRGRFVELRPPRRVVVSWGHAGSEQLPPCASRVEIRLKKERNGTTVQIVHSNLPGETADAPSAFTTVREWLRGLWRRPDEFSLSEPPRPRVYYRWPHLKPAYRWTGEWLPGPADATEYAYDRWPQLEAARRQSSAWLHNLRRRTQRFSLAGSASARVYYRWPQLKPDHQWTDERTDPDLARASCGDVS